MAVKKEINDVLNRFPTLTYNSEKNELVGELFISEFDSYDVCIHLNPYPDFFPQVFEIGERIPPKMDRHIYTDTKSCCLTTTAKSQILLKTKITSLILFMSDIVIPYFQNNSYFEIEKKYKTDEYSHGPMGVIESYYDILQINDVFQVSKVLYHRLNESKLSIRDNCYCGLNFPLKKCTNGIHRKCYKQFKLISKNVLNQDFNGHFLPVLKSIGLI